MNDDTGFDPSEWARAEARVAQLPDPIRLLTSLLAFAPFGLQIYSAAGHSVYTNRMFRALFGSEPPPEFNVLEEQTVDELGVMPLLRSAFAGRATVIGPFWFDPRNIKQVTITEGNRLGLEANVFPLFAADGTVGHVVFMMKDLTAELTTRDELRKTEEALRKSEASFRDMIERLPETVVVHRHGVIQYVNPAGLQAFGYDSTDELLGQHISALLADSDDRAMLASEIRRREHEPSAHAEPARVELNGLRKDGTRLVIDAVAFEASFDGAPARVAVIRDVSEHKNLQAQLAQSQKMEAVGQLAGGIAHDFNNILSGVLGFGKLALDGLPPRHPVAADLTDIVQAAERAAQLTRQLLAFSRRQVLEPKVLDVSAHVQAMESILRRLLGEHLELVLHAAPNLGRVKVDPSQLEQVILNLAINARDAMPSGGRLVIETANVFVDDAYARDHVGIQPGNYVMMTVSDTGEGIPKAIQHRVFEPFFTTKEQGRGTGLGLATVFGIVKQSGGHIWMYSEPGKGTLFRIYFPRSDDPMTTPPPRVENARPWSGNETVLVVEDDGIVRAFLKRALQRQGYTVLEAANGGEALLIAEQHPGPIHLVVSDVVMPRMSGPKLIERLREVRDDFRVIFLSGYAGGGTESGPLPAADFLAKPVAPELLVAKVRAVLDRA